MIDFDFRTRKAAALVATIERAKREILQDMEDGIVPRFVRSFSDLHDYVDANVYGGLCDEPFEYEEFFSFDEEGMNLVNEMQGAIERWLQSGNLTDTRCFECGGFVDAGDEPGQCQTDSGKWVDICSRACTAAFYGEED